MDEDFDFAQIAAGARAQVAWNQRCAERAWQELNARRVPRCECGRETVAGRDHCGLHYPKDGEPRPLDQ